MPWTCQLVDIQKSGEKLKPGDMWFAPWMIEHNDLSHEYKRDWKGKRPPLFIKLPNNRIWGIDFKSSDKYQSWTVTGVPPKITVYPSVNSPGPNGYHGFLVCGFLSDDMDGRLYHGSGKIVLKSIETLKTFLEKSKMVFVI
ncbi:hypothetical protein [Pelotomaculum propionicicum]|uniref:Uncharacterized protein n=1 Tax=Pelotomaculum propionicicum TaxID=258475 RepID=A0A4Y7RUC0_9FIRM|nr:hypothetical protein [Pelotomaculum propionicicum]NLI12014.1 hypothetical protein [Peptococcaceae bacterium]TEB12594.1 hypothetical protein Pmgp_00925 [Pelotomaculum propionicicum]